MPIVVTCPKCSKVFRTPDAAAGADVPCPGCAAVIPAAGPTVTPFDAFISYSSKDKTIADAVVATLEADGVRCWVAPRDIVPGTEWSDAIIQGINDSRMVVLIFSAHSNASQQVLREVERAVNRGLPIVPFRIENLLPSRGMEYFISASHWLDAYHAPLDDHLRKLSETAQAILTGQPAAPRIEPPGDLKAKLRAAVNTLASRDHRPKVLVGLALLVALLGAAVVGGVYALKPPTASAEVVKAKADAEGVAEKVKALDPGQGLQPKMDDVGNHLRTAQALYDQKEFAKAHDEFRATTAAAEAVLELASDRDKAQKELDSNAKAVKAFQQAKEGYEKELSKYNSELLAQDDPVAWKALQERVRVANEFPKTGRLSDGPKAFEDSAKDLQKLALPRLKYIAHELGGVVARIQLLRGRNQTPTINPMPFGQGLPASPESKANTFNERLKANFVLFDGSAFKTLQLPAHLVDKLRAANTTEVAAREVGEFLRNEWGEDLQNTYRIGNGLTDHLVRYYNTEQTGRSQYVKFEGAKAQLVSIKEAASKVGYPALGIERIDTLIAVTPEGGIVIPSQNMTAAAAALFDLFRLYDGKTQTPNESRFADAKGMALFRPTPPAPSGK